MAKATSPVKAGEVVDVETGEVKPMEAIKAVNTMDATEFQRWLESEGASVEQFDGGSEWALIGDKDDLVGVPFVIATIRWNDGKSGKFVSVCAFKEDGTKIVFNDGGTGVYQQLQTYENKHKRNTGILCKNGLRVSRYEYTDDQGVDRPATTYYIA